MVKTMVSVQDKDDGDVSGLFRIFKSFVLRENARTVLSDLIGPFPPYGSSMFSSCLLEPIGHTTKAWANSREQECLAVSCKCQHAQHAYRGAVCIMAAKR